MKQKKFLRQGPENYFQLQTLFLEETNKKLHYVVKCLIYFVLSFQLLTIIFCIFYLYIPKKLHIHSNKQSVKMSRILILLYFTCASLSQMNCNCDLHQNNCIMFCAMQQNKNPQYVYKNSIPNANTPYGRINPMLSGLNGRFNYSPSTLYVNEVKVSSIDKNTRVAPNNMTACDSSVNMVDEGQGCSVGNNVQRGNIMSSVMASRIVQRQLATETDRTIKDKMNYEKICKVIKWLGDIEKKIKVDNVKLKSIKQAKIELFRLNNISKLRCSTEKPNSFGMRAKGQKGVYLYKYSYLKTYAPLITKYKTEYMPDTSTLDHKPLRDEYRLKRLKTSDPYLHETFYRLITTTITSIYTPSRTVYIVDKSRTFYQTVTQTFIKTMYDDNNQCENTDSEFLDDTSDSTQCCLEQSQTKISPSICSCNISSSLDSSSASCSQSSTTKSSTSNQNCTDNNSDTGSSTDKNTSAQKSDSHETTSLCKICSKALDGVNSSIKESTGDCSMKTSTNSQKKDKKNETSTETTLGDSNEPNKSTCGDNYKSGASADITLKSIDMSTNETSCIQPSKMSDGCTTEDQNSANKSVGNLSKNDCKQDTFAAEKDVTTESSNRPDQNKEKSTLSQQSSVNQSKCEAQDDHNANGVDSSLGNMENKERQIKKEKIKKFIRRNLDCFPTKSDDDDSDSSLDKELSKITKSILSQTTSTIVESKDNIFHSIYTRYIAGDTNNPITSESTKGTDNKNENAETNRENISNVNAAEISKKDYDKLTQEIYEIKSLLETERDFNKNREDQMKKYEKRFSTFEKSIMNALMLNAKKYKKNPEVLTKIDSLKEKKRAKRNSRDTIELTSHQATDLDKQKTAKDQDDETDLESGESKSLMQEGAKKSDIHPDQDYKSTESLQDVQKSTPTKSKTLNRHKSKSQASKDNDETRTKENVSGKRGTTSVSEKEETSEDDKSQSQVANNKDTKETEKGNKKTTSHRRKRSDKPQENKSTEPKQKNKAVSDNGESDDKSPFEDAYSQQTLTLTVDLSKRTDKAGDNAEELSIITTTINHTVTASNNGGKSDNNEDKSSNDKQSSKMSEEKKEDDNQNQTYFEKIIGKSKDLFDKMAHKQKPPKINLTTLTQILSKEKINSIDTQKDDENANTTSESVQNDFLSISSKLAKNTEFKKVLEILHDYSHQQLSHSSTDDVKSENAASEKTAKLTNQPEQSTVSLSSKEISSKDKSNVPNIELLSDFIEIFKSFQSSKNDESAENSDLSTTDESSVNSSMVSDMQTDGSLCKTYKIISDSMKASETHISSSKSEETSAGSAVNPTDKEKVASTETKSSETSSSESNQSDKQAREPRTVVITHTMTATSSKIESSTTTVSSIRESVKSVTVTKTKMTKEDKKPKQENSKSKVASSSSTSSSASESAKSIKQTTYDDSDSSSKSLSDTTTKSPHSGLSRKPFSMSSCSASDSKATKKTIVKPIMSTRMPDKSTFF